MSVILYNIVISLYSLFISVAALFHPKARLFIEGRRQIFKRLRTSLRTRSGPVIWMHCASLGEFEQGSPVLEEIRSRYPHYQVLLTFFSPSGYEAKKDSNCADHIFYLPVDRKRNVIRFLDMIQPACALFVKYELWYHYLDELQRRRIPAILFSAYFQKNQIFFKPYGNLYRKMLSWFQLIFVQDEYSRRLLSEIGIDQVSIAGDTRFDQAIKRSCMQKQYPFVSHFKGNGQLIVAGSTWQEDEILLSQVFSALPATYRLLIAPHEIKEENVQRIRKLFPNDSCLWTDDRRQLVNHRVCIVNAIGHLAFLYRYADIVWMGGGFTRTGIHNLVEPAVYGVPLFFGPNFSRFREAEELIAYGAARSETDIDALIEAWQQKDALSHQGQRSKQYVNTQQGATDKIVNYIQEKKLLQR